MRFDKIFFAALAASAVIFVSCDDKKDYVAGEPDAPDCMGVYFDEGNPTDYLFMPDGNSYITVAMHRKLTDSEADIPLISSMSIDGVDGIEIPQSVHFDAGSADATFVIDCNNMPTKVAVKIRIDIPEEFISHYSATLFNYETTALASAWEPANTDESPVKFWFTTIDGAYYTNPTITPSCYEPILCEMDVLPGAGLIRINNFINSGLDMILSLTESPYSDYEGKYRVRPTSNFISMAKAYESDSYGDQWYNAWYIYSDEEDDYLSVMLTSLDSGKDSELDYPLFFSYSDTYAFEYSYAVLKSPSRPYNCVSMGFSGTPLDDSIIIPNYFYLYFSWDGESSL